MAVLSQLWISYMYSLSLNLSGHDFCFVCLNHINVPFQHMQAILGQTESCHQDTMPYSCDRQLEMFYMHYHRHNNTLMTISDPYFSSSCEALKVEKIKKYFGYRQLSCAFHNVFLSLFAGYTHSSILQKLHTSYTNKFQRNSCNTVIDDSERIIFSSVEP